MKDKRFNKAGRDEHQRQYNALGEYFRGPGQSVFRGAATFDEDMKLNDRIERIIRGAEPDPRDDAARQAGRGS